MTVNTGNAFESPARKVLFYEFDEFRLDVKKEELLKNGEPFSLTHKAFQVLLILVQSCGETVEKENIYQQLWGDSFVEDANLTQHIYILRKTLGPAPSGESYIETVARSGYRFTSEVRTVFVPQVTHAFLGEKPRLTLLKNAIANLTEEERLHVSTELPIQVEENSRRDRRRFFVATLAIGLLIVAGIVVRLYFLPPSASPVGMQAKSIAVLPFKTIGNESANEKLGLGMADAVITRLGRLKTIPVRPTSTVFHYTDNPPESSLSAGHEMGVDTILEGTVQRDIDRVRVSVRLINVADGNTVWAENFDENSTDIFKVQDSISTKVVRALRINLTQQQENALTEHATSSTQAYEAFQQGVYFGNFRTKDGLEKAVAYFQKAVEADANYARAYAMLADSYNMLAYYHFADPYEMKKNASDAATKAMSLDDDIPEPYIALSYIKLNEKGGIAEAKDLIERAIETAPFNSTAHVRYGWILLNLGYLDKTVEQMRLAQEYDPVSPISNGALCNALNFQGKADEAIKYCEKSAELAPGLNGAQLSLAETYFAGGRRDDAVSLGEKIVANGSDDDQKLSALGSVGYFHAKLGHRQTAEKIVAEIRPHASQNPFFLNDLVVINYALGKRDEGYAYFQQLFEHRALPPFLLKYDPAWADVRADERVIKLINKMPNG